MRRVYSVKEPTLDGGETHFPLSLKTEYAIHFSFIIHKRQDGRKKTPVEVPDFRGMPFDDRGNLGKEVLEIRFPPISRLHCPEMDSCPVSMIRDTKPACISPFKRRCPSLHRNGQCHSFR